jgi:hypothetical protein
MLDHVEDMSVPNGGKDWTFLVYLAGDNNLERFGLKDLQEMKAVGSNARLNIVAQFDRMSDQITRRYLLTNGPSLDADCVMKLPEVNTGDPRSLVDFITWALHNYPAKRLALVLWNHGSGWKDEDIYQVAQRQGIQAHIPPGQVRSFSNRRAVRCLFRSTLDQWVRAADENPRAILFDDSAADFLDNLELQGALLTFLRSSGRKIDLLGMDACLMSMLEVHYQLRNTSQVIVASQEVEPGDGWPYERVLAHLAQQPKMDPNCLGEIIVQSYLDSYHENSPELPVTQSAIKVSAIPDLAQAVDGLGKILNKQMNSREMQESMLRVYAALRLAQSFSDRDYVDLKHFCSLLAGLDGNGPAGIAAQTVVDLLQSPSSPIITQGSHSPTLGNSGGISIYLPVRLLSPLYDRLDFSQHFHWDDFIRSLTAPL